MNFLKGTSEAADALLLLREVLESYEVVWKGMKCTGRDEGVRPIHVVIVGVTCHTVARSLLEQPNTAAHKSAMRLASLAVAAALDYLMEFRGARRLVRQLVSVGLLPPRNSLIAAVEPQTPKGAGLFAGANGFLACSDAGPKRAELERMVGSLLSRGYAVSTGACLPDKALLMRAEAEATKLHKAGQMFPSSGARA